MQRRGKWQVTATAISSLALVATVGTGAQAAGGLQKCGNRAYTIQVAQGTVPQTFKPFKVYAKNVAESGTTCVGAFNFVGQLYREKSASAPAHFKCVPAKATEPAGYYAQLCSKGAIRIEFGRQGG